MESGRPLKSSTTTGLPVASIASHQFVLPADQVEARAVAQVLGRPRLARGLLVAADGEHDDVGPPGDLDGLGDLLAVFRGIARRDLVLLPGAADGDLAAFAVEHLDPLADPRPGCLRAP